MWTMMGRRICCWFKGPLESGETVLPDGSDAQFDEPIHLLRQSGGITDIERTSA